ncbi:nuclear transport factor 2 family protein [Actinomadura opuntiae]|uniref:nuclear transport factor 2 family protein n=1 Tax=Actinomadura sp. OS1-43 TaxID=604315 RepID=UPI00255AF6CA|nr:nuclear transport factor 2 family protein [Actinomadura sp. OS1-43]MDL4814251.1 nuclear transport factor 2 family protein [Actinomadura sp. OS1-43]
MQQTVSNDDRIGLLADRAAVIDVVTLYATALDVKDWAALASLFTPDATWEFVGGAERLTGPEAITSRISAVLRPLQVTQHLLGNHVVRLNGDTAEHTCYFQAQHVRRDGEKYLGAGRYDDRLVRTPEGWRFTYRRLTSMWNEGNVSVIAPEQP